MSLDGRISLKKSVSTALSGDAARKRVQELRHEHDAILVGSNTAVTDNPSLTDRSGLPRRRPLVRIVLDNRLRLPTDSTLATTTGEFPTIVFTNCIDPESVARLTDTGVQVMPIEGGARNVAGVLDELRKLDIQSVLIEGGTEVAGAAIEAGIVDKVTFIVSPIILGGHEAPIAIGGKGPETLGEALRLRDIEITRHGEDIEITGYPVGS
jgi:diaminohydroxyphosphoribosylaminopyrimidine deaminase/5-amino-6-(5-phosphoribosylamino)uracil reductase